MLLFYELPNELIFKILNFCDNSTLYTLRSLPELSFYTREIQKYIAQNNASTIAYHSMILRNHLQKWMKKDNIRHFDKYLSANNFSHANYIEDITKTFTDHIKSLVNKTHIQIDTLLIKYKNILHPIENPNNSDWFATSSYQQKILNKQLRYLVSLPDYYKFGQRGKIFLKKIDENFQP